MARTAIPITRLVHNDSISNPAGTTIDSTLVTAGAVIVSPPFSSIMVRVNNTSGADRDVIVRAGIRPIASMGGYGDLTEEVPATSGSELFYLNSSRYAQTNGDLYIDFESGFTGTIAVIAPPKNGLRD